MRQKQPGDVGYGRHMDDYSSTQSKRELTGTELAQMVRGRERISRGEPLTKEQKRVIGLYDKFVVVRTDGSSEPGRKHEHCKYFVLDLNHDPFAKSAILAYADACESEYPELAKDLRDKANQGY